jgi:hypothetical protein
MLDKLSADKSQAVMRGLLKLWGEFSASPYQVQIIDKLNRGKFRLDDYRELLCNHRQQVVEGARWIARASSRIGEDYLELRSQFLKHAITEHRDYQMIERDYISVRSRRSPRRRRTSAPRRCTPSSSTAPASRTPSTSSAPCSSSRVSARRRPPSGAAASGTSSACATSR